jgi:hypothetical protein
MHAKLGFHGYRWMIAFFVEAIRKLQHIARAIFHTKAAAFALLRQNVNLAMRDFDRIRIKRPAPELHKTPPLKRNTECEKQNY